MLINQKSNSFFFRFVDYNDYESLFTCFYFFKGHIKKDFNIDDNDAICKYLETQYILYVVEEDKYIRDSKNIPFLPFYL